MGPIGSGPPSPATRLFRYLRPIRLDLQAIVYPAGVERFHRDALQLFGIGYSWGGFQRLIIAGRMRRTHPPTYEDQTIIRLNIGLEDPGDLIMDLEQALRVLPG